MFLSEVLKAGIIVILLLTNISDGLRYRTFRSTSSGTSGGNGWIAGAVIGGIFVIAVIVVIIFKCYIFKSRKTGVQPITNDRPVQSHPAAPSDYNSSARGAHPASKQSNPVGPPDYNTVYGNGLPPQYNTAPPPAYAYSDPAYPPQY